MKKQPKAVYSFDCWKNIWQAMPKKIPKQYTWANVLIKQDDNSIKHKQELSDAS